MNKRSFAIILIHPWFLYISRSIVYFCAIYEFSYKSLWYAVFDNPKLIINQVQCICCNFETFARDSNLRVSLCGILIGYAKLRNKIYASL